VIDVRFLRAFAYNLIATLLILLLVAAAGVGITFIVSLVAYLTGLSAAVIGTLLLFFLATVLVVVAVYTIGSMVL
jgi:hypothetical protein